MQFDDFPRLVLFSSSAEQTRVNLRNGWNRIFARNDDGTGGITLVVVVVVVVFVIVVAVAADQGKSIIRTFFSYLRASILLLFSLIIIASCIIHTQIHYAIVRQRTLVRHD